MIDLLASSPGAFLVTSMIVGLLVGSFLNVVIHRMPIMLDRQWRAQCMELAADPNAAATVPALVEPYNLVVPRSACPSCKEPVTALQNIPVVSWLALKGRCARCGNPISARYPLVEALTGLLTLAVAWKFGFGWPVLAALVLTWFLIALTFIDIDHQLLPDDLTLPLIWLGLAASLWGGGAGTADLPVDLRSSLIGAMAGYVSLWSVYHLFRLVTGKDGMGYGDFKLFGALGAWLGWQMLLPIILLAATSGAILGILMLAVRGKDRGTPIAFGPFLAVAGWAVMMWGRPVVAAYLGLYTHS